MKFKVGDRVMATTTQEIPIGSSATVIKVVDQNSFKLRFDRPDLNEWNGRALWPKKFNFITEKSKLCQSEDILTFSCPHSDVRDVFISSSVGWIKVCHDCKQEI